MAARAHYHLQLRPGTNVALLNGLMHVIVDEGLADEAFIAERTEDVEALLEVVAAYTPELVEEITGVPAGLLCEAARAFGSAERAAIVYSMGITQHSHGTEHVLAVSNLALLTGNLGKPGAGRQPAARPEQRAGRLRHGRAAQRVHGLPAGHRQGGPAQVRAGLGREPPGRRWASR